MTVSSSLCGIILLFMAKNTQLKQGFSDEELAVVARDIDDIAYAIDGLMQG